MLRSVTDRAAAAVNADPDAGVAALCRFVLGARAALVATTVAAAVLVDPDPWRLLAAGAVAAVPALAGAALLGRRPSAVRHPVLLLVADVAVCAALLAVLGTAPLYVAVSCTTAALSGALLGLRSAPLWLAFSAIGYLQVALHLHDAPAPGDVAGGLGGRLTVIPPLYVLAGVGAVAARGSVLRHLALARSAMAAMERSAIAGERGRMARELHDSVAQTLRGLSFAAVALPASLDRRPELAGQLAGTVALAAQTAAAEARDLLDTLRSDDGETPFADVVRQACAVWSARTGVRVTGDLQRIEVGVEARHEVLRILREALSNVERHSGASTVRVDLLAGRSAVHLAVRDDGSGFAVPDDVTRFAELGHYGLLGMAERAARVGGSLRVSTPPGGGTAVLLRMPSSGVSGGTGVTGGVRRGERSA